MVTKIKKMESIVVEFFWKKEEANDVNNKGVVNIDQQGQLMHGNLCYNHHSATIKHEYKNAQLTEIQLTAILALQCSTILFCIVAAGLLIKCLTNRKCGGDEANATTKDREKLTNQELRLMAEKKVQWLTCMIQDRDRMRIETKSKLTKNI